MESYPISAAHTTIIERSPEDVFDYFADLRNEPAWNRGHVQNVVLTSAGPVGLGSSFEGDHPGFGKATWRITEYDRPRHVVIEGLAGKSPYRYVGDFEPHDAGTLFTGRTELDPGGWTAALGALMGPVLKVQSRRSFGHLRSALERHEDGR
jgi:hypothetical protein